MVAVRNQAVELLRIVSALGIVWFHAGAIGSKIAGGGLIVFVVLSAFFIAAKRRDTQLIPMLLRFSAPWAIWLTVYGLFNLFRGLPFVPMEHGFAVGLLAGSSIHLWFLPYMAIVVVAITLTKRMTTPFVLAIIATLGLATTMLTFAFWYPWSWSAGAPFTQYLHVLPAILTGTALGAMRFPEQHKLWGGVIVICVALIAFLPAEGAIAYTLGIVAVTVALLPLARDRLSRLDLTPVSGAMFGVYLLHPLALYPFWRFIAIGHGIPVVLLAFSLSVLAVLVTKRISSPLSSLLFGY